MAETEQKQRRVFRKFQYRGVDLDNLLDLSNDQLMDMLCARPRRRFNRGLKRSKYFYFSFLLSLSLFLCLLTWLHLVIASFSH